MTNSLCYYLSSYKTILLFLLAFGCTDRYPDLTKELEEQKYDQTIIYKVQLYDSLRQIILKNYDNFTFGGAYNDFTYIHYFDTTIEVLPDIPDKLRSEIVPLFNKIGAEDIEGFTISIDSTVKFKIRSNVPGTYKIYESLYWYPNPNMIEKIKKMRKTNAGRGSFFKDTILNYNWQYEIELYEKPALLSP